MTAYAERRSAWLPGVAWISGPARDASAARVLPDGCMDVIWDGRTLLVAGPDTRPHDVATSGGRYAAVRLDPGVAPSLLGTAAADLRDVRVPLDDLWSSTRTTRWRDAIAAAAEPLATLERLAAEALAATDVPGWVGEATRRLRSGDRAEEVARSVALSPRELRRRAPERFGYGPKTLQRILRLQDATAAIRAGDDPTTAASAHGFSDYPHLHREARTFLGSSPAAFRPGAQPELEA